MRGYLTRDPAPDGRRKVVLRLTARGEEAARVVAETVQDVDDAIADRVGAEALAGPAMCWPSRSRSGIPNTWTCMSRPPGPAPGCCSTGTLTGAVEVLLAHMGGPYFAAKDEGAWSIPKGEYAEDEAPWDAARREFEEETGQPAPDGPAIELGQITQRNRKVVTAYALEGDFDRKPCTATHSSWSGRRDPAECRPIRRWTGLRGSTRTWPGPRSSARAS